MADNDNDITMTDSQQEREKIIIDEDTNNEEEEFEEDYTNDDDPAFEDDNNDGFEDDPENAEFDDGNDEFDDGNDEFEDGDDDWGDEDELNDINCDANIMSGAKSSQFESVIPEMTSKSINSNCDEINMIPLFAAQPDLKSRSRIGAMVGIRVANLTNITSDQLEVWGLTPQYPFIALKFEFGPFYLNEAKVPKVEVGMCAKLSPDEKLHPFRLSWTIEERLNNAKLTNKEWPPKGIDMKDIPKASTVNDLMESSAKEYALVLQALKKYKGDEQQALTCLLDSNQAKKLMKNLPSIASCEAEFADIMSKISTKPEEKSDWNNSNNTNNKKSIQDEYKSADDSTKIQQISEMYGIAFEAASLAYSALGYDEAVDKLSDISMRNQYIDMANASNNNNNDNNNNNKNKPKKRGLLKSIFGNKGKKSSTFDDEKTTIESLPDFKSMVRTHSGGGNIQCIGASTFFRTICVMNKHNFLLRCVCFALKILLNGNKYCMICDKELAFAGLKPTICSDRFCQWRHDQIGLGFSLSSEMLNRPDICDLLISMTYSASNAGRIQFFFPYGVRGLDPDTSNESFLLAPNGIDEPDLTNFDVDKFISNDPLQPKPDITKLKKVIDLCPAVSEISELAREGDVILKKELTKMHALLYPLLVWIITSNRCHLRKLPQQDRIKQIDTEYQFALCSATPDREKEFQDIKRECGSFLAWHGSPMGNWHSILRMGLRNYSKTKHQSNGAAYGSGIYFGRNFSLSWGYCRPGSNPGWKKSKFGTQMSCMALCEICYHKGDAKHHKNKNINNINQNNNNKTKSNSDWAKTTSKTNRWVKTSGIYVVNQEECVMTRFFLIFPKTSGYKQIEANS
eukprot:986463_1